MIIGLTGGIGSGKSTVAKIFATLGIPIYDADSATKNLMQTNQNLKDKLIEIFGKNSYINNELNRKFIGEIVFNNIEKLNLLNSIVHPYSIADANNWAKQQITPYVIKEAALLYESEAFHYVDYTIGVTAPLALRIARVMKRDQINKQEVEARINKQIPDTIKMKLCNFVINNNEASLIITQVLYLHNKLLDLIQK
jgi:dephospho-CoA kinase